MANFFLNRRNSQAILNSKDISPDITSDDDDDVQIDPRVYNIIHISNLYDVGTNTSRLLSAINLFKQNRINPLIFFSGDFLSPSTISCITNGEHMIDIMNTLGITCGMIGTHDFDFGEQHLYEMIKKLNFPVICTNLSFNMPKTTRRTVHRGFTINYAVPTVETTESSDTTKAPEHIASNNSNSMNAASNSSDSFKSYDPSTTPIPKPSKNLKIGILGICENWLHLIEDRLINADDVKYDDMLESTQKAISEMREQHGVDMVIALTHSKLLTDRLLAEKIHGIDLILGGNDRINTCTMSQNTRTLIVKSGCNFKNFSWIQFMPRGTKEIQDEPTQKMEEALRQCLVEESDLLKSRKYWFRSRYYAVTEALPCDSEMKQKVDSITKQYHESLLDTPLGAIECDLDCTESSLLSGECNSANLVTDVVRVSCKCDCVILSATSFLQRTDSMNGNGLHHTKSNDFAFNVDGTINRGTITHRDIITKLYTDMDRIVVLEVIGSQIRSAIEHGLATDDDIDDDEEDEEMECLYVPQTKFPHVSGLRFVYDPQRGDGDKINSIWIMRYNEGGDESFTELQDQQIYSIALSSDLANGGDGYEIFQDPVSILRGHEDSLSVHMILIDFFHKIGRLNDRKVASQSAPAFARGRWTRKRIEAQIEKLALTSKALSSCIETKWISSKKWMNENKENATADDDEQKEDDDAKEDVVNEQPEVPVDAMLDSEEDNDVELGTTPNPENKGMNGINGVNGTAELKEDEEEVVEEKAMSSPVLGKQTSLKDKWKNMDKNAMKERFSRMRSSSKVKLGMMGTKLKKMAIESSEKAKTMINSPKEIQYDEEGNVLDVEIFVVRPKVDHRVMTETDEQKWLEAHHRIPESGTIEDDASNMPVQPGLAKMKSSHYVDLRNPTFPKDNRANRSSVEEKNVKQQLKSFFVSRDVVR